MPYGRREESLFVRFPSSEVQIRHLASEDEPDEITLSLKNPAGDIVGTLGAYQGTDDFQFLSDLWSEAYRSVTGWDEVLADIEQAINQPGKVAQPTILPSTPHPKLLLPKERRINQ